MAVRYVRFEGERCSYPWWVFLTAARREGISFGISDLNRSMGEQSALFRQNMYPDGSGPRPGRPLTARPSPNAPHIREGQWDHAGDLQQAQNLINFAASKRVRLVRTVASEEWHCEFQGVSASQLIALFLGVDPYSLMSPKQRRVTKELVGIRDKARRRGYYLESEKARARSIKRYLGEVVRGLRDLSDRQLDKENRRERLELARDALAGRPIEL